MRQQPDLASGITGLAQRAQGALNTGKAAEQGRRLPARSESSPLPPVRDGHVRWAGRRPHQPDWTGFDRLPVTVTGNVAQVQAGEDQPQAVEEMGEGDQRQAGQHKEQREPQPGVDGPARGARKILLPGPQQGAQDAPAVQGKTRQEVEERQQKIDPGQVSRRGLQGRVEPGRGAQQPEEHGQKQAGKGPGAHDAQLGPGGWRLGGDMGDPA